MRSGFKHLVEEVNQCSICAKDLPQAPKPILQIGQGAKILIAGQAPGKQTHVKGKPFDDSSGVRLREWLSVTEAIFYDASKFAILPMGFCYPGKGASGDLPPRSECAQHWRARILSELKNVELTIVIGKYAMEYHLVGERKSLTQQMQDWETCWPYMMVLPHPSPRNNPWLKKNPWFESERLPLLRKRVAEILR